MAAGDDDGNSAVTLLWYPKYHIHKCKWKNKNPSIIVFKIKLREYFFVFETSERLQ